MAFGQQSGPPATAKQMSELLALLEQAGHDDFRDARGPLGFTQRQAGGKFTRDEADAFIAQLQDELAGGAADGDAGAAAAPLAVPSRPARIGTPPRPAVGPTGAERALRRIPTDQLAAELQRRGWVVLEP
jgi:hypothetical protein